MHNISPTASAPNAPYATLVWNRHLACYTQINLLPRLPTPDSRLPTPDPPTLPLLGSSRMTDEAGKSYREGKARTIFLWDYSQ
ncbi:MAG: hypothetical protein F6K55_13480 [Moorea sp. SIO4A3]|nr:hypothetical protein [Moorena sp. SIO4A3]